MEETDISTIGKRSVHGILALVSRTFFLNIISLVASLIVFSILSPRDVGIYTAVLAMQRVVNFFTDFGLGAALVQKKEELKSSDLITTFSIQMIITFSIFIFFLIVRNHIGNFFGLSEPAVRLLMVLVFTIFLSSFKTIPSILLERKINFQKLIIPQIVESLVFNLLLIILVLKKFGLDSFAISFIVSGIIGIPIYYYISPWPIRLGIDRKALIYLKYGIQFQAKNVLATLKDDLLTVFLTKLLSFSEIGYIGFAQKLAFFAYRYIVDSVTKVTFSTYARIQEDVIFLRKTIEKSLFFVSLAMFPLLFGVIITGPYIISYFPKWHNKWEPALVSLIFFCLNALISSFSNILITLLDSTGRVKVTLKLMSLWTTLTWILTPLFIFAFGYNGVSLASFLITATIIITIYQVKKVVEFSFVQSIYKSFIAAVGMILFVYIMEKIIVHDMFSLLMVIFSGILVYLISIYLLAAQELISGIKVIFNKYEK